jgi:hypothetical protein
MLGGTDRTGQPRPIPGPITFIQHGRVVATADAGADGRFSRTLAAGDYQVQACTSTIQTVEASGAHQDACAQNIQAHVLANQTTTVAIPDFIVP